MQFTYDIFQKKYVYPIMKLSSQIFNSLERFNSLESVYIYDNQGFVAKINERVIGYITFAILYDNEEPRFTITTLGVDPEFRKMGIGRKLIRETRNYFRKTYAYMKERYNIKDIIYLHVRLGNYPAKTLYESIGFKMEKVMEKYYIDPQEDAVYMSYKMGFNLASNDDYKTGK